MTVSIHASQFDKIVNAARQHINPGDHTPPPSHLTLAVPVVRYRGPTGSHSVLSISETVTRGVLDVEAEARKAWDAYRQSAGGISKFTGDKLPEWDDVDEDVREHYRNIVRALLE